MPLTLKQQVEDVLKQNKKAMHVDEIAQALIEKHLVTDKDKETLANNVSAALSSDIKRLKTKSPFKKVKNKQGKYRKGIYQLRPVKVEGSAKVIEGISKAKKIEMPTIPKSYTGTAGEHLVLSELLFHGFNASSMAVDDGVDIVCFKDEKFYYIQVKTANITESGKKMKFQATIKSHQFEKFERHKPFYIIVLRYHNGTRILHDFVVLPSMDIERYIEIGVIKSTTDISIVIEVSDKKIFLNGDTDISYYFNKFELIK